MAYQLLSTSGEVQNFLARCTLQPWPELYIDLEGNNLCRLGTISLITIFIEQDMTVYMVDVTTLQGLAFTTAAADGTTLKNILESPLYTKVFFDIRNDSDALYSLYGIRVNGIEDLQLLELASRDFAKTRVNGLAKCIERDAILSYDEKRQWQLVKNQGKRLFGPEHGGSYAVFDQRPLSKEIAEYCCQDVRFMPNLRRVFRAKLCDAWWVKIGQATQARIRESQSANYDPKGVRTDRSLAPVGWSFFVPTMLERQERTMLDV